MKLKYSHIKKQKNLETNFLDNNDTFILQLRQKNKEEKNIL
jgi:hypothetical protein